MKASAPEVPQILDYPGNPPLPAARDENDHESPVPLVNCLGLSMTGNHRQTHVAFVRCEKPRSEHTVLSSRQKG